jgi:hypothetical protein
MLVVDYFLNCLKHALVDRQSLENILAQISQISEPWNEKGAQKSNVQIHILLKGIFQAQISWTLNKIKIISMNSLVTFEVNSIELVQGFALSWLLFKKVVFTHMAT